jgi:hypothetical protein
MKKQTAVQYLSSKVMSLNITPKQMKDFLDWYASAKEMEKDQIEDAYDSGQVLGFYLGSINENETDQTGEIFYQEKYK